MFRFVAVLATCVALAMAAGAPPQQHQQPPEWQEDAESAAPYLVGVGSADITGTIAEVGFMGYAMLNQKGSGLHMRSRARAYVFVDATSGRRAVFVNLDICMTFHDMVQDVVKALDAKYGVGVYTYQNVMISSTHTHSTAAGYSRRVLYEIASLGFYKDNFEAVVNGIVAAIAQAHSTVQPANLQMAISELHQNNINRSPASYDADPAEEKAKYAYNTDHDVTGLKIVSASTNEPIGMISWFAVHGTSMNNTNLLYSSDNKGYAEQQFERWMNGPGYLAGDGPFVAAFAQSNEGDVSPNTAGPRCPDGSPCDYVTSTCGPDNTTATCIATGPGKTDFESCEIIGARQAEHAWSVWNNASAWTAVPSGLGVVHQFVDMSQVQVPANWTTTGKVGSTCAAALGYAFAGGTTDGPGDFPFEQGTTNATANPFWGWVTSFLGKPSAEQVACQDPKPILLDVSIYEPFPWVDQVLPLQIMRLGDLYLAAVPGEFTTMSGRRLRNSIRDAIVAAGGGSPNMRVVVAGLSNAYSHYITTWEEYQVQRYEGGSTLFGPHTLAAYQMLYSGLATSLVQGTAVPPGPTPVDLTNKTFSLIAPVIVDVAPAGKTFGSIDTDVAPSYSANETASVVFVGANPRNNLMTGATFLTVELLQGNTWVTVVADADWSTKLYWSRRGTVAESYITITWDIPTDVQAGTYRIGHFGYFKEVVATFPYSGYSSTFTVTA